MSQPIGKQSQNRSEAWNHADHRYLIFKAMGMQLTVRALRKRMAGTTNPIDPESTIDGWVGSRYGPLLEKTRV